MLYNSSETIEPVQLSKHDHLKRIWVPWSRVQSSFSIYSRTLANRLVSTVRTTIRKHYMTFARLRNTFFLMKHWKSLMKFRTVCCVHFFLQTDWNNKIVAEAHDSDLFIRLTKSIFQSFLTRLFDCVASLAREMHSKPACLDTFSSVVLVASASRPTIVDIQTFISHKHFQYKKYGAKKKCFFYGFPVRLYIYHRVCHNEKYERMCMCLYKRTGLWTTERQTISNNNNNNKITTTAGI